ncbi:MAG: hypothetical protein ABIS67_10305 [Candidatus Eisenbacteria bacterium]
MSARALVCTARPPRFARLAAAALVVVAALAALAGCNTARLLAPPPPLRAASAATFAIDVEFAEPLAKGSAEDASRYTLTPVGPGSPVAISTATLVDTLNGRVVQLLVPDWLSSDPDGTEWVVTTRGVLTVWGKSTGTRSVTFRAGLSYATPLKALYDARCSACHGPSRADGSYRTDSYPELLGNGTDGTANLIPGDVTCLLVRKCKPHNSMFNLAGLSYFDYEMIRNWVASYNARP